MNNYKKNAKSLMNKSASVTRNISTTFGLTGILDTDQQM